MYRQDTFSVDVSVGSDEELLSGIYVTEDSYVTYNATIFGQPGTDEGVHTEVDIIEYVLEYVDEDGAVIELTPEQTKAAEQVAKNETEEYAHEEAWEARYDDRA